MRKNDFLPRLAAAAVIFTAIMFSNIFVKAQSNNEYQVVNTKVNQDAWHYEKPCPPCPTFPVTKQESPKRLPCINGGYIICSPTINVNTEPKSNKMHGYDALPVYDDTRQIRQIAFESNDSFANSAWMVWILLVTLAIGWLLSDSFKRRNSNTDRTIHHHDKRVFHQYYDKKAPAAVKSDQEKKD